jgi:hypothetical protein
VEVLTGAAQGSLLSPVLYILGPGPPMAVKLRQLHAAGCINGILLPDGSSTTPCHQHADASIHPSIHP